MINLKLFYFNPFRECCAVLFNDIKDNDGNKQAIIVDPGFYDDQERDTLFSYIKDNKLIPNKIILTHGHFDHIFGVEECVKEFDIPVYMHPADKVILENDEMLAKWFGLHAPKVGFETVDIKEGDVISLNKGLLLKENLSADETKNHEEDPEDIYFEIIESPGHTPGGVCFYDRRDKVLFSGDSLFAGSIGRTDSKWGDYDKLIVSIMDKIMGIDGDVEVIPGHGPKTSISDERTNNPFLQPFNEPLSENIDWDEDGIELDGLS